MLQSLNIPFHTKAAALVSISANVTRQAVTSVSTPRYDREPGVQTDCKHKVTHNVQ